MDTRRWGSFAACMIAASCVFPSAGQNQTQTVPVEPLFKLTPAQPHHVHQAVPAMAGMQSNSPTIRTTSGHVYSVKRTYTCTLTAYTAGFESTGKRPGDPGYGITASGKHALEGRTVAVDPTLIPMGTPVWIEGIGLRYAEDTGGAVKGPHIDVFFNNPQTAIEFGVKRNIPVYVIEDTLSS